MKTSCFLIFLVFLSFNEKSYGLGGGRPQEAEFERLKLQTEARCQELEQRERELADRVNGKNLEKALKGLEEMAIDNAQEAIEGSKDYFSGKRAEVAARAATMARSYIEAKSTAEMAAADLGDSNLRNNRSETVDNLQGCREEVDAIQKAIDAIRENTESNRKSYNETIFDLATKTISTSVAIQSFVQKELERRENERIERERQAAREREIIDRNRGGEPVREGPYLPDGWKGGRSDKEPNWKD